MRYVASAPDGRRQMTENRAMRAELPDPDKLVAFDGNRTIMVVMAEDVEKAMRPPLQEPVQLLVDPVRAKVRSVDRDSIEWTPPAKAVPRGLLALAHPDGSGPSIAIRAS